jgi:hypothetical protein
VDEQAGAISGRCRDVQRVIEPGQHRVEGNIGDYARAPRFFAARGEDASNK